MKPETYCERRSSINENVLEKVILIIGYGSPHLQDQLGMLMGAWEGALDQLDEEFEGGKDEATG